VSLPIACLIPLGLVTAADSSIAPPNQIRHTSSLPHRNYVGPGHCLGYATGSSLRMMMAFASASNRAFSRLPREDRQCDGGDNRPAVRSNMLFWS